MTKRPTRRRAISPITRRILAVNVLALAILVAGLLYLGKYRQNLIDAELAALHIQAEMFAAALGEGAVAAEAPSGQQFLPGIARQMVRRLAVTTRTRARLFDAGGALIADSRTLVGPGGAVQVEELPPPDSGKDWANVALKIYDRVVNWLPGTGEVPPYQEKPVQRAGDYAEVVRALGGDAARTVGAVGHGDLVLIAAVPVQRYKQVLGALMMSRDGRVIDAALLDVRLDILKVFLVALGVTVLLSLYLAGTIARPLRRLARAAERVRHGHSRQHTIPDMGGRGDEIGELARSLRSMTQALWQRMDAIDGFAADVAHEIKNPLTSLRSAVETAARIENPEQQQRLMAIILDDVQRLDRLISDISDASRLDSELSRAEIGPVDLGAMLSALAEVHGATAAAEATPLNLQVPGGRPLMVDGTEGRLVQVFRNILANALSFSPPGGTITMRADRDGGWIRVAIDDEGPGIPEGKEGAIFERFYSQRPAGEKFGTHSGLGLSISKQIVEAHGGTIEAENRRPDGARIAGTRFIVLLPASEEEA